MADQIFEVHSGFYDAVNRDRLYSADEMNRPYKRVITNGVFATPAGTPSADLQVTAPGSGMNITVAPGEGLFGDKWYENPSIIVITVPNNSSANTRIDSVIAQVDRRSSGRVGNIVYRTGTAAEEPEAPPINNVANVYEYRLANITVAAGANVITGAMITDMRGTDDCPWVTSLIKQVDTSTLFRQYQTAFEDYFDTATRNYEEYKEEQQEDWDAFVQTLTDELTVDTNVIVLSSFYIAAVDASIVPIGIASFNPLTDALMVFQNGLQLTAVTHYAIDAQGENVLLKAPVLAGQNVSFICFKSVISADLESTVRMMQNVDRKVSIFMQDGGWLAISLQNGAAAWSADETPRVRCIGNRVYIRGAFKGIASTGDTIGTIPVAYAPAVDYYYTHSAIDTTGNIAYMVTLKILAATGEIKLYACSGELSGSDMISLSTDFLANIGIMAPTVYVYKGAVATYADLPATGQQAGDVYVVNAADPSHGIGAGDEVVWNGAEWEIYTDTVSDTEIDDIIDDLI